MPAPASPPPVPRRPRWAVAALWGAALVAVLVAGRALDVPALLGRALGAVRGLGAWAPALFVGLYVVATVLALPGSLLTVGAGALFGLVGGAALASLAATLGATAAFLVGRHVARGWIARRLDAYPALRRLDDAVARDGWRIVLLARLSPVVPFNVLNYAFGLTRISLRAYVGASWAGMLPGTVTYTYLGSLAGGLVQTSAGERARTPLEWALYGLGLLATLGVTVHVTRLARAALARQGAGP